ncbi:MAG: hypothetical protein CM15mV20_2440 [uncultured marine virus]|jgi:hypothetical protein|nr:MAG: hypothetical protein CM15mV20_2440 [uncultured marine virus]|tara:strand:- start:273 stop:545 length:273 start_codon:yes stop_codon:yes gene_type:complete
MELEFFKLLGHIQMKLTESNVKASFDNMKDHLAEHDVTAEFVDIDYNYYGHTELMGPVVTFKSNKPDMDWYVQVSVEKDFPMLVGVIRVS